MDNLKKILFILFLLCSTQSVLAGGQVQSVHCVMGIPKDKDASDDYLIVRKQYVLSYNKKLNVPNWVSWNLNASWYGAEPRFSGQFIADTSLPSDFTLVKHSDYTRSGYDRGHMVRSEERTATAEDNRSTFLLTNILPQTPTLNQLTWLSLEYFCEKLCKEKNKELFVIAGGRFSAQPQRLNGIVAVPDSCWKIIVVLERGESLKNVTAKTPVIAVMMPNKQYEKGTMDWFAYTTSVKSIEQSTGYDLLSEIPDIIEKALEQSIMNVEELMH